MKIAVAGAGYAGLVSATGWAMLGNRVTCIDKDERKVRAINSGKSLLREPGLGDALPKLVASGNLAAASDYSAAADAEVFIIAVGTPAAGDGSQDLSQISDCAASIGRHALRKPVVVVRSTVLPGTTEGVVGRALGSAASGLAMMPEFLREGSALADFMSPDRIVVGTDGPAAKSVMDTLCRPFQCPKLWTGIRNAEMIKYASNILLAARLSVVNELACACMEMGLDIDEVVAGAALDRRIGGEFLRSGPGFGGSCLPKDISAMHSMMNAKGGGSLLGAVIESNRRQQELPVRLLGEMMGLKGATVAVLGLSFKAGTDDVRGSPSATMIKMLQERGARVRAYDPSGPAGEAFPGVELAGGWEECIKGADAAIIATPWPEFMRSAAEYSRLIGKAPLIDCWRVIGQPEAAQAGLSYRAIGRGWL